MKKYSKIISGFLFAVLLLQLHASDYEWLMQSDKGISTLEQVDDVVSAGFRTPGNTLLFRQAKRMTFRHDKKFFNSGRLSMELCASGNFKKPLKAWIFAKDKDGNWYQSEKEYSLVPEEWVVLNVETDKPGRNMLPVGHNGAWNGMIAGGMYEVGVSVYGEENAEIQLHCRGFNPEGKRVRPELGLVFWTLPEKITKNKTFESRFQLTREYFNPFDPDEIEVNYEIALPGNTIPVNAKPHEIFDIPETFANPFMFGWEDMKKTLGLKSPEPLYNLRYPAFFTQDFTRSRHFTRENVMLSGEPMWAFRMTPHQSGKLFIRLHVLDRSGDETEEFFSAWRALDVEDSDLPGVIRVSSRNPRYFEFSNGEFFFPLGINIHTNTDIRSEFKFNWGHLPDRGTYDYDDYFNACGAAGINMMEIWMASWTYALEWDSARPYYYGLGRYNMANAWKLDHLFKLAEENGIYINLVLDAHGKLSTANDQEWEDNPFNSKAAFSVANGAILENSKDFWTHSDAQKFNWKRNRYIMARWGPKTNLFSTELWSEVNLVANGWDYFKKGHMTAWHRQTAREIQAMDQGGHLIATHVCGDSGTVLNMRHLAFEPPEFTHIACNAYRSTNVHIVDQLRKHGRELFQAEKPMMIMEYGGTNFGSKDNQVRADVHGGIWGAIFAQQAGTPLLWWHDFIHIRNMYPHFLAFSKFMRGVDLPKGTLVNRDGYVSLETNMFPSEVFGNRELKEAHYLQLKLLEKSSVPDIVLKERFPAFEYMDYSLLCIGSSDAIGWVYDRKQLMVYPADPAVSRLFKNVVVPLDLPLDSGNYMLCFYDTVTGDIITSSIIYYDGSTRLLPLPPFRVDIAFKLMKLSKNGNELR